MKYRSPFRLTLSSEVSSERGIALVFIAMLIVPILIFISLAIDTQRLSSTSNKQRRVAGLVSLVALEAYVSSPAADHASRMRKAFERAHQVAAFSDNILFGTHVASVTTGQKQLKDPSGALTDYNTDEAGELIAGTYHMADGTGPLACASGTVASTNNCPCNGSTWNGPCFQPRPPSTPVTEINAFQTRLHTQAATPVRNFLGPLAGADTTILSTTVQAALIPRLTVFLVDISRSMQFDNFLDVSSHNTGGVPDLNTAEYAFQVSSRNGSPVTCPADHSNPCLGGSPAGPWNNTHCMMQIFGLNEVWSRIGEPAGYIPGRPDTRPAATSLQHFKQDYRCYTVFNGTANVHYLVNAYAMAEPLKSVVGGIHTALEVVQERSVRGDKVAALFFDENAVLTARKWQLTSVGEPSFDDLLDITDVTDTSYDVNGDALNNARIDARNERFLFPRADRSTDLPSGLLQAYNTLVGSANIDRAQRSVILFSDGVNNCGHWQCGAAPFVRDTTPTGPSRTWGLCTGGCDGSNPWNNAMGNEEISIMLSGAKEDGSDGRSRLPSGFTSYRDKGISLHAFMISKLVMPNQLMTKNKAGNGCTSDHEARANNLAFTKFPGGTTPWYQRSRQPDTAATLYSYTCAFTQTGTADRAARGCSPPQGPLGTRYFEYPNFLFYNRGARSTSGYWVPLREPCTWPGGTPACLSGAMTAELNSACAGLAATGDRLTSYTRTFTDNEGETLDAVERNIAATDNGGALRCDPLCRTKSKQINDAVRQVYLDNPFALVGN